MLFKRLRPLKLSDSIKETVNCNVDQLSKKKNKNWYVYAFSASSETKKFTCETSFSCFVYNFAVYLDSVLIDIGSRY